MNTANGQRQGRLVHGVPVSQTEFGRDPVSPVRESDVRRLLEGVPDARIVVVNAETEADLAAAVKFTARSFTRVLCGIECFTISGPPRCGPRTSGPRAVPIASRADSSPGSYKISESFRRPVVLAARRVHPVQGPAPGHGVNPNRVPSHGNDCESPGPHTLQLCPPGSSR